MIDVMFFLLATFMLASLSMQHLNSLTVNLPKGKAAPMSRSQPVTLTVTKESKIYLDHTPVTLATLAQTLKPMLKHHGNSVVVSADRDARDGVVVRAMLEARKAGANQLLIAIQHE